VEIGGVRWSAGAVRTVTGEYGARKAVVTASCEGWGEEGGVDDVTACEILQEALDDEVQSVRVAGVREGGAWGDMHVVGFGEPHKRYQNSFTVWQKRGGYSEPVYSWSP
jgi:hypothetical protein